jgi:hypothetical protein
MKLVNIFTSIFDTLIPAAVFLCVEHYTGHICIAFAAAFSLLYLKDRK